MLCVICYLIVGFLGLCVGSFLNVLILRLPKNKKITGRSYCLYCKKKLRWYELVPVFSYIFLRGKCYSCKKKISLEYTLVEVLTALFFIFITWQISNLAMKQFSNEAMNLIFWFFFSSILIVIFFTDLKYYIVPDKIIFPAIGLAILYQIFNIFNFDFLAEDWFISGGKFQTFKPFLISLLTGFCASLFFFFLVLITKGKGMGFGDVKIAGFMGVLLSFPNIIVALALAFFSGSVVGLILVAMKKKTMKSEVPFGCFLAPSTFIAFFWGSQLISLYWRILL